ncbi:hypothetical protein NV379_10755 [Paenibacillus sp. N1-5-1-14]|uniref:hypothetical protein n=1 Tax=Paenibacillus radicibacter TaxID=2972488 RepID=UPI0021598884|nr:hypothetical protein [Paenibacillus radicibacter]MCR8643139.1 hypothetical protein [Paenibacillus radicibacter]
MYRNPEVRRSKMVAASAYLLFFIPLLIARHNRYAMYHCNQGLVLFLTFLACNVFLTLIPVIGWVLIPILNIAFICLAIFGILNAIGGVMRPLPIIGKLSFI